MILLDTVVAPPNIIAAVIFVAVLSIIATSFVAYHFNQKRKEKFRTDLAAKEQSVIRMMNDHLNEMTILKTEAQKVEAELRLNMNVLAMAEFEKFKQNELEQYQKVLNQAAVETAQKWLSEWKILEEKGLREDAIKRSMSVNLGKITEHLIPFSEYFKQFNPKDARFIGSPIDLIVFDGGVDEKPEINIYFVEIKTGASALTPLQKRIRYAVEQKNVHWLPISMVDFKWDVPDAPPE